MMATAKMKSSANHLAIFTLTHCGEHLVTGALAVGWACTAPAVATDGIFVTYKVGSFKDARVSPVTVGAFAFLLVGDRQAPQVSGGAHPCPPGRSRDRNSPCRSRR
jgi:hypothetical protein